MEGGRKCGGRKVTREGSGGRERSGLPGWFVFWSPLCTRKRKGKWKSVSQAMTEEGVFCASPQQCEDKFNDLNKRYRLVRELLGGVADCRCPLPHKTREETRKLLCSKKLFFPEMCIYHISFEEGEEGIVPLNRNNLRWRLITCGDL